MLVKFGFYSFDKLLDLTDTLLSLVEKNMIDVGIQKDEERFGKELIEQKVCLLLAHKQQHILHVVKIFSQIAASQF